MICCLFYATAVTSEAGTADDRMFSLYEESIFESHEQNFEQAFDLANQIRNDYPEEPAGLFAFITIYQNIMETYRVRLYEAEYDSIVQIAVKLSEKALKRNRKEGRNYFYVASAYGSRSLSYARQGKWLAAFRDGTRVKSNYEKAIRLSPEFYDAYYGLGLYDYWITEKASVLKLFGDNQQRGIDNVKLVADKGRFMKNDAMFGLSAIYYNERAYDKCLALCEQLYENFPKNPAISYRIGRVHQQRQSWPAAKYAFENVLKILDLTVYKSISYRVACLYQLAKCAFAVDDLNECRRLCEEALELDKSCDFSLELDGPNEDYSDIKKELNKLLTDVKKA
jgi:tetratricopeptide (TPR) repeat protein